MKPGDIDGWLFLITVAMRHPGRDKFPIRFNLHATDIFQMGFNQKTPHDHERYGRDYGQIDERDSEDHLPKGLLYTVAANSYSVHYSSFSLFSVIYSASPILTTT